MGTGLTTFQQLDLIEPLQQAVAALEYVHPTPIQVRAIPPLLDSRDVLGCAQTGTGKTAAFALPVLQQLALRPGRHGKRRVRALVLTPTRELAAQIGQSFHDYGQFLKIRHTVIFGGVKQGPQVSALRQGIEVLVATPGRLLDLMGQGLVNLDAVEFFILDEADRMLDMGFIRDIRKVLEQLPEARQNLLFSATMPPAIAELARSFLHNPVRVDASPPATTVRAIDQHVMFVARVDKKNLLIDVLRSLSGERVMVFTRTKHGANRVVRQLERAEMQSAAIHGNKSQNARTRALDEFKSGETPILVATDIASRGLDVDDVGLVINYDLPNEPESYVHRIGRTGRAGRTGVALAFCDETEGEYLRAIEKLTGEPIPVIDDHVWHSPAAIPPPLRGPQARRTPGGRSGPPGGMGGGARGRRPTGRRSAPARGR